MPFELSGKVLKFGDSIDTDAMLTGKYLELSTSETEELGKHAMETIDPEFPKKVKEAPIIVAGSDLIGKIVFYPSGRVLPENISLVIRLGPHQVQLRVGHSTIAIVDEPFLSMGFNRTPNQQQNQAYG